MLKKIILGLLGFIVVAAVVSFFLPQTTRVERSITINAPQSVVFAVVNNFNWFNEWSPWYDLDPNATITLSGKPRGVGAQYSWKSDDPNVGSGSQKITKITPYQSIAIRLDFGDQGQADVFYNLSSQGDATEISWGFESDNGYNPIARYFGLMLDKWLGPSYEQGLQKLKVLVEEKLPKQDFADLTVEVTERKPLMLAYVSGQTPRDNQAIGEALGQAYAKVAKFIADNELEAVDRPVAITEFWDNRGYGFKAGIPITRRGRARPAGDIMLGETYGGKVLKVVHKGAYSAMSDTYKKIDAYLKSNKIATNGDSWERYVSDPGDTPQEQLVTEIYFPIKDPA